MLENNELDDFYDEEEINEEDNWGGYIIDDPFETAYFGPKLSEWYNRDIVTLDMQTNPYLREVEKIGANVFAGIKSLETIILPKKLKCIGSHAFYGTSIKVIILPEMFEAIEDEAFVGMKWLESVVFPEELKCISRAAFKGVRTLKLVAFPKYLDMIDEDAFANTGLTSINLSSKSCTEIKEYAFLGSKLSSLTISSDIFGDSGFRGLDTLKKLEIQQGVEFLGDWTFSETGVTEVIIPSSMKRIDEGLFYGAELRTILLPDSITVIDNHAFERTKLNDIRIPDSVISIGESAFDDCKRLTIAMISKSTQYIGDNAFRNCKNLSRLLVRSLIPPVLQMSYNDRGKIHCFDIEVDPGVYKLNEKLEICVPMESVELYKTAEGWKEYANNIIGVSDIRLNLAHPPLFR